MAAKAFSRPPPARAERAGLAENGVRTGSVRDATDDLTDTELVHALLGGESWAARAVWRRYSPIVRGMMRRSLGPEHDVEDVVQEVFLRVFEKTRTLREPAAFRGFIMSIAVLTMRYEIRRRRVRRWVGLAPTANQEVSGITQDDMEGRQALRHFYGMLDAINSRDRMAFMLYHVEGMDVPEVSIAMGVSLSTTRRCLSRARQRVQLLASRDPFLVDYVATIARSGAA